jgi:hypothetical protein
MLRHSARGIVAIVLLACFVCPVVELFDYWDHTISGAGNDTEYTLVVVALCIGIVFSVARLTVALFANFLVSNASSILQPLLSASFFSFAPATVASISGSPPLNLRI